MSSHTPEKLAYMVNQIARNLALDPDPVGMVAQHIQDTVQRWDAEQMSALIELNIGKDLQYIRINGTVVGGLIGLVLFGLSHAREIARAVAGG